MWPASFDIKRLLYTNRKRQTPVHRRAYVQHVLYMTQTWEYQTPYTWSPKEIPIPPHTRLLTHHWKRQSCLLHRGTLIRWTGGGIDTWGVAGKDGKAPISQRVISILHLLILPMVFYTHLANAAFTACGTVHHLGNWGPSLTIPKGLMKSKNGRDWSLWWEKIIEVENTLLSMLGEVAAVRLKKKKGQTTQVEWNCSKLLETNFSFVFCRHRPWECEDGLGWRERPRFWDILRWGPESSQGPHEEQPPPPNL